MKRSAVWGITGLLAAWILFWWWRGSSVSESVLLHWPIGIILVLGYAFDLKGSLLAALAAVLIITVFKLLGMESGWTVIAWQVLICGIMGLYPFKFMQVREQRRHHYQTLIEYKKEELDALRKKLADVDRKCREIETRLRRGSS